MTSAFPATLAEAVDALRARKISSVELVSASLRRAEAWQPHVNAFLRIERDKALADARDVDAGKRGGSLRGVPVGLKDMFLRANIEATAGSSFTFTSERTATAVTHLEAAGAILIGRLNLSEFAAYSTGENPHYGDCRNPWDTTRIPGGSSSGCAAALACAAVLGAVGTDTGGSGRTPAALCGVTGLKPTPGLISLDGVIPRARSLDTVAPMARTALDCALLLDSMVDDPLLLCRNGSASAFVQETHRKWIIGMPDLDRMNGLHPAVATALQAAATMLAGTGSRIVRIPFPSLADAYTLAEVVLKCEAAALHGNRIRESPERYGRAMLERTLSGFHIAAVHYLEALASRPRLARRVVKESLDACDAMLLPSCPQPAPEFSSLVNGDRANPAAVAELTRYLRPFNYLGLPSLAVPAGFVDGLPVGLQLVGRPYDDAVLLAIAHGYQQVTDWHARGPRFPPAAG